MMDHGVVSSISHLPYLMSVILYKVTCVQATLEANVIRLWSLSHGIL